MDTMLWYIKNTAIFTGLNTHLKIKIADDVVNGAFSERRMKENLKTKHFQF